MGKQKTKKKPKRGGFPIRIDIPKDVRVTGDFMLYQGPAVGEKPEIRHKGEIR